MRRLKKNQLGPWCTFCPPKTTRAVWREDGWRGEFACECCKGKLLDLERDNIASQDHLTEADYQTWMRL